MKIFLICLLLSAPVGVCSNCTDTQCVPAAYTLPSTRVSITSFESEYRLDLYKPNDKKWSASIGGKISPDYDIFGNEIKTNVFTTIGVDF